MEAIKSSIIYFCCVLILEKVAFYAWAIVANISVDAWLHVQFRNNNIWNSVNAIYVFFVGMIFNCAKMWAYHQLSRIKKLTGGCRVTVAFHSVVWLLWWYFVVFLCLWYYVHDYWHYTTCWQPLCDRRKEMSEDWSIVFLQSQA